SSMGRRAVSTRRVRTDAHRRAGQHAPEPITPPLKPGRNRRRPRNTRRVKVPAQSTKPTGPAPVTARGAPTFAEADMEVVDDFATTIPMGPRELEVIETYLGTVLDEVLGKRE